MFHDLGIFKTSEKNFVHTYYQTMIKKHHILKIDPPKWPLTLSNDNHLINIYRNTLLTAIAGKSDLVIGTLCIVLTYASQSLLKVTLIISVGGWGGWGSDPSRSHGLALDGSLLSLVTEGVCSPQTLGGLDVVGIGGGGRVHAHPRRPSLHTFDLVMGSGGTVVADVFGETRNSYKKIQQHWFKMGSL